MRAAPAWKAAALLLALTASLAGCGGPVEAQSAAHPEEAVLGPVAGTDTSRITLTEKATARLGITAVPAAASGSGSTVPYSALLYDAQGQAWVYVVEKPTVFLRKPVVVQSITGATATLTRGLAAGAKVVSVGVTELFGAETGVGH
jgi:hypothetical protein